MTTPKSKPRLSGNLYYLREIKKQKLTIMIKNREITGLKHWNKEAAKRAGLLTDALAVAVLANKPINIDEPSTPAVKETKSGDPTQQVDAPIPAEPEKEPNSVFKYTEYKDAIKNLDLDSLKMDDEANAMTPSDECEIDESEQCKQSLIRIRASPKLDILKGINTWNAAYIKM